MSAKTKRPVKRRNDEDQDAWVEATGGPGAVSLDEGSGLRGAPREILQTISQVFRGQRFTVEQLAQELGSGWSQTTVRKTLHAFADRSAPLARDEGASGITSQGRANRAGEWSLTEHGKNLALADRVEASASWGEGALESRIAHFEDEALAEHAAAQHGRRARGKRAALARVRLIRALVKRLKKKAAERTRTYVLPHGEKKKCRLCRIEHSLHSHRSHRIDGARRRYTLAGAPVKESNPLSKKAKKAAKKKATKAKKKAAKKKACRPCGRVNPTLADAAETWARHRGLAVPARSSAAWKGLYAAWQRSGMQSNPKAKKPAKKAKAKKPAAKKKAKKTVSEKTTTTTRVVKKTTSKNPLVGVLTGAVNPRGKGKGKRPTSNVRNGTRWKDLTKAQQKDPVRRKAAMFAARLAGIPLDEMVCEIVEAQPGTSRAVPVVYELEAIVGKAQIKSRRAKTRSGRRISWHHKAGDLGGGKKAKPQLVARDMRTGRPILVSRRGSRAGVSSRRGLLG